MASDDSAGPFNPPPAVGQLTTWWKVAEIIGYGVMGFSALKVILGDWIPGFFDDKLASTGVGVLAVTLVVIIRYWRAQSPLTTYAARLVRDTAILTAQERDGVAGRVERLDRRNRTYALIAFLLGLGIVGALVYRPMAHALRKRTPSAVAIEKANYYVPSQDAGLLRSAPFFEAISSTLAHEGTTTGGRFQIITVKTEPFRHPTRAFDLEFDSGQGRFDLAGYAFRLRTDKKGTMYEPLHVRYGKDGAVRFEVPPSEDGDWVFCMLRVTLKVEMPFPDDLKRELHVSVHDEKEKQ